MEFASSNIANQLAGNALAAGNDARIKSLSGKVVGDPAVDKVAKELEAVFVAEMLKHMFSGIKPDEVTGGGFQEEMFQGIMVEEYGKAISHNGNGIGIQQAIKEQILKLQTQQNNGGKI